MRKYLLSALLATSVLTAFAGNTMAQEIDVPLQGSVEKSCFFEKDSLVPGILAPNDATLPTQLGSMHAGGTAGRVHIVCNSEAKVSAYKYSQVGGDEIKVDGTKMYLTNHNLGQEGESVAVEVGGSNKLDVNFLVNSPEVIKPGKYAFVVHVTAVPQ
jgi:hypothetical protein